jgi:hypothetical protein
MVGQATRNSVKKNGMSGERTFETIEKMGTATRFLDLVAGACRKLEMGCSIAEKVFKPLEFMTAALGTVGTLISHQNLDRTAHDYEEKKNKKLSLIGFGVLAAGLGLGVIFFTGIGAIVLIAAGYVVSAAKMAYLHHYTAKNLKVAHKEQLSLAQQVKDLLSKPQPSKDDFHVLSEYANKYVQESSRIQHKQHKQSDRKIDIALTGLAAVAFVLAVAFPPVLMVMGAIGLGIVAVTAGRKLFQWAKDKYPNILKFGKKLPPEVSAKDQKYKILNEMIASVTPSGEAPTSFAATANAMLHRYEQQHTNHESSAQQGAKLGQGLDAQAEPNIEVKTNVHREIEALQEESRAKGLLLNGAVSKLREVSESYKEALKYREDLDEKGEDLTAIHQKIEELTQKIVLANTEVNGHKSSQLDLASTIEAKRKQLSSEEKQEYNRAHLMSLDPSDLPGVKSSVHAIEIGQSHTSSILGLPIFDHHDVNHPHYEKRASAGSGEGESVGV